MAISSCCHHPIYRLIGVDYRQVLVLPFHLLQHDLKALVFFFLQCNFTSLLFCYFTSVQREKMAVIFLVNIYRTALKWNTFLWHGVELKFISIFHFQYSRFWKDIMIMATRCIVSASTLQDLQFQVRQIFSNMLCSNLYFVWSRPNCHSPWIICKSV